MSHDIVNPAVYETVADYMKGKEKKEFKKPDNRKLTYGEQRSIPNVECASLGDARARVSGAGFDVSTLSTPVDSKCPAGTAAGTSPDGRTIKGGAVQIQVSNGKGAEDDKPKPGDPATPPGDNPPRRPGR